MTVTSFFQNMRDTVIHPVIDGIGLSDFARERAVWDDRAGVILTREVYNQDPQSFKYRTLLSRRKPDYESMTKTEKFVDNLALELFQNHCREIILRSESLGLKPVPVAFLR